ncbi:response regulator [Thermosynechococcaceae cyanobacterium BACA0444]|uniref:histidine kinase n=1 Tax=Pseudocalidococcus azoricus BACA0444 TaxID=2918990 RepID=A0AAE4FUV3_9CYAN|nr:response regulator [Pseudocalidococcus azoricus]MDS3861982.1 response regulator [Pseudocalidococcus azoricus BACA0444]
MVPPKSQLIPANDGQEVVRQQFLEEAQDYLEAMETGLLGLSQDGQNRGRVDGVLRAAHSIKGGAAMMGFTQLSDLAHRLEDFLKVIRAGTPVEIDLEQQLLRGVDCLQHLISLNRQGMIAPQSWLNTQVDPVIEQLQARLGDLQPESEIALLSEDAGGDMRALLFESEVEGCLQRLEAVLASPEQLCLLEELKIVAQELEGLGQMLELPAFISYCASVSNLLEHQPYPLAAIATEIVQGWRRCQAMVLVGQFQALPERFISQPKATDFMALEELPELSDLGLDAEALFAPDAVPDYPGLEPLDISHDQSEATLPFLEVGPKPALAGLENLLADVEAALDGQEFDPVLEFSPSLLPDHAHPTIPSRELAPPAPGASESAGNAAAYKTVRVAVKQLDELADLFGELTIERNGLGLHVQRLQQQMQALKDKVRRLEQSNFQLRQGYDRVTTQTFGIPTVNLQQKLAKSEIAPHWQDQFDALEFDRYNPLHQLSQDVIETIVQIQEITSDLEIGLEDTERTQRDLHRTAKQMQNRLTQVRMRPFADLANRYPRMVRDLCHEYGKEVQLEINGGNTLVDRTILEALADPLLHLVRNAFDHGIESPAERTAQGKPNPAKIAISAAYRGSQTIIQIADDGQGINLEKIKQRGLEMGLDAMMLNQASERELVDLIFEPGFTTATQVTELSGRGVGMDVVRTNLQKLRGEIQVETKPGLGTTFTITVPFTLSVVRVLLVEIAGMLVAVPTDAVEEMTLFEAENLLHSAGQTLLDWDGLLMPLIQLEQWFNFPRPRPRITMEAAPIIDQPTLLVIAQGDHLLGIPTERYWGEQEVTIRQVDSALPLPPGFSGCTILGDGRIVPLVDTYGLWRWLETQQSQAPNLKPKSPGLVSSQSRQSRQTTVLIVDDSINVRRFLANTLEKAGYRVEQAKDGQEALDLLSNGLSAQAVICDIEMPRLDGYGFLSHAKNLKIPKNLPVVMLTSRSSEKHRQIAINLGATAYFTKPFREADLLATLKTLVTSPQPQPV